MEEKLYIRRLGDTRNVSRHNVILMNPTPLELIMLVSEYEETLKNADGANILVNPEVIKTIYFKLFNDSSRWYWVAHSDINELNWYYDFKHMGHDTKGRSLNEFKMGYYLGSPLSSNTTGESVSLIEHRGGQNNTFYSLRHYLSAGYEDIPICDEPILSQKKLMNNTHYHLFACGALIFLQVYGWIEVPRFQKHELCVI